MSGSATDDLLTKSKLLRQRIEARNNLSPTAAASRKSSDSKVTQLDRVTQNQSTAQQDSFPMLIGNLKKRRPEESIFIQMMRVMFLALLLPIFPFMYLFDLFQQQSYKREYAQNILNPAYLRGTGLMVRSDISAELITKGNVPRYMFEKEDITSITHHTIRYGLSHTEFELRIHLHEFHALTLYGFTSYDSEDMVTKLVSLYDVELNHTTEYVDTSDGGGGGG
jgi:hypothetical protein